jgi:hypothetical protein
LVNLCVTSDIDWCHSIPYRAPAFLHHTFILTISFPSREYQPLDPRRLKQASVLLVSHKYGSINKQKGQSSIQIIVFQFSSTKWLRFNPSLLASLSHHHGATLPPQSDATPRTSPDPPIPSAHGFHPPLHPPQTLPTRYVLLPVKDPVLPTDLFKKVVCLLRRRTIFNAIRNIGVRQMGILLSRFIPSMHGRRRARSAS